MTNVYKIKLFRWDLPNKNDYRDFCIERKILAVGWASEKDREYKDLDDYIEAVNEKCTDEGKKYGELSAWVRARECMKKMGKDAFCWTQIDGKNYRLGKIMDEQILFNGNEYHEELKRELEKYYSKHTPKEKTIKLTEFGLWGHCDWKEVNFDDVPGNVIASLAAQGTTSQISSTNKEAFYAYCQYLYDRTKPSIKLNFWDFVHYDDLEDLVGLYLQKKYGYFVFPSTNKQGTKDYEYKLINSKTKKEAIIQCKHTEDIPWSKLEEYKEEDIYVLSIKESKEYKNRTKEPKYNKYWEMGWQSEDEHIKIFDADRLKEWACKEDNKTILPQRIQKFLEISS